MYVFSSNIVHRYAIPSPELSHVPPYPLDLIDDSIVLLESCLHTIHALELLDKLNVFLLGGLGSHLLISDLLPGGVFGFALYLPLAAV